MTEYNVTKKPLIEHQECVAEAGVVVFATACGQTLQSCENCEDFGNDRVVTGVISIVGDVEWSIFLVLPEATAIALVVKFAGFEVPFDSDDMGDAVGELTNILAGEVKRKLDAKGVKANITLPSIFRSEGLDLLVQRHTSVTKTCFVCEGGKLWTGVICSKEGGFASGASEWADKTKRSEKKVLER